ncbi:MAG: hypothetical protein AB1782_09845 [Cyanobacteriota bacterium]
MYEDTATAFVNSSDALSCEIEELKAVIDNINTLIPELNNKGEALEAVIEYNEVAEKLAPALKKVMAVIEKNPNESGLCVYETYNGGYFGHHYIGKYFESLPKLYVETITPDKRADNNALLIDNLWHYNKDHC